MKKSSKHGLEKRLYLFLILIIISACGIYYSLNQEKLIQAPLGNVKALANESELSESLKEMGNIIVEISGLVKQPGIYTLAAGATVGTLCNFAGGLLPEAALTDVDLSTPVFNMQKITIKTAANGFVSEYSSDLLAIYYPPPKKKSN